MKDRDFLESFRAAILARERIGKTREAIIAHGVEVNRVNYRIELVEDTIEDYSIYCGPTCQHK